MAEVPNADDDCFLHSAQWHMYNASGRSRGVLNDTAPHWHCASMVVGWQDRDVFLVVFSFVSLSVEKENHNNK